MDHKSRPFFFLLLLLPLCTGVNMHRTGLYHIASRTGGEPETGLTGTRAQEPAFERGRFLSALPELVEMSSGVDSGGSCQHGNEPERSLVRA
jgi:hypothetical protein